MFRYSRTAELVLIQSPHACRAAALLGCVLVALIDSLDAGLGVGLHRVDYVFANT